MSNEISNISDEIHGKVDAVVSTFSLFTGPLVYVRADDSLDSIDVDAQFELFKVVFFEYFDDSIRKIKGLEALGARITHHLGFTYYSVSEDGLEEIYKFHWQNLVWFDSDPGDDRIWDFESYYHYVLEDDEKKIEDFSKECENLVMSTLENLKYKFEEFKARVLKNLVNAGSGSLEIKSQKESDDDYDKMFKNVKKYFDENKNHSNRKHIFEFEDDLNEACKIITNFLLKRDGVWAKKPLNIINGRKTKFGSILGLIRVRLSTDHGLLKDDLDYLNFVKKNFLIFNSYTDSELVNSLQKSYYT